MNFVNKIFNKKMIARLSWGQVAKHWLVGEAPEGKHWKYNMNNLKNKYKQQNTKNLNNKYKTQNGRKHQIGQSVQS